MTQTQLNFNPLRADYEPPHNGTETSRRAAEAIRAKAPSHREQILIALRYKPMTREALAAQLGIKEATVCGRVFELKRDGYVREMLTLGETVSGNAATILEITESGERVSYLAETGQRG